MNSIKVQIGEWRDKKNVIFLKKTLFNKMHKRIFTDCLADTHFAVFLLFAYSQRKVLINKTAAYFVSFLSEKRKYIVSVGNVRISKE